EEWHIGLLFQEVGVGKIAPELYLMMPATERNIIHDLIVPLLAKLRQKDAAAERGKTFRRKDTDLRPGIYRKHILIASAVEKSRFIHQIEPRADKSVA